ncbi:class I SAM-dependent methyltransferase [Fulvivirga lutea]|uniref:Class I SAM-dependent methyltransferase n=1 Tax=Fulvivirga lutea TaxID=2810512 RepID=A0A974WGC4_9BACT|nr:class I SAM-dependent methyltransferase [Fulvivirga lutea]QSE97978.1 class I SAM-dependent methyltransferase [Fulvivirga lutea]
MIQDLNKQFGNIDIYLLDQILKGRFENCSNLLDAGCGEGRNLTYFENRGLNIYGCDTNLMAIKMARMSHKNIPSENLLNSSIEDLELPEQYFDAIICTAVMHFAKDEKHFHQMLDKLVLLLKNEGILFIRMATDVGIQSKQSNGFTYLLPESDIENTFTKRGLQFIEPWKSVVVKGERSMGVFTLLKT